jgi:hypothetical protein
MHAFTVSCLCLSVAHKSHKPQLVPSAQAGQVEVDGVSAVSVGCCAVACARTHMSAMRTVSCISPRVSWFGWLHAPDAARAPGPKPRRRAQTQRGHEPHCSELTTRHSTRVIRMNSRSYNHSTPKAHPGYLWGKLGYLWLKLGYLWLYLKVRRQHGGVHGQPPPPDHLRGTYMGDRCMNPIS